MIKNFFISITILSILIISLIYFSNLFNSNDSLLGNTDKDFNLTNYALIEDSEIGIKGVLIKNFKELNLINNSKDLKELYDVCEINQINFCLNAGYFLKDYSHAGFLKINNELLANVALKDTQLTHILNYNNSNFNILNKENYNEINNEIGFAFQTGPLIINENKIEIDLINNSINGLGEYKRSVLGFSDSGDLILIYTIKDLNLIKLAEEILKIEELQNKNLTFINLDGGSSVSFYSKFNDNLTRSANKIIPFILGVNL